MTRTEGPPDDPWAGALVAAQMVLLAVLATPGGSRRRGAGARARGRARPGPAARALGVTGLGVGAVTAAAAAASLGPALTPSPLPRSGTALRTDGLYARVRHPIYTGLLVAAAGRALASGRRHHVLAAATLGVLLKAKSAYEEQHLRRVHPDYDAYAAVTPGLVPTWSSLRVGRS